MAAGLTDLSKRAEAYSPLALPGLDFSAIRGGVATPPNTPMAAAEPTILRQPTREAETATADDLDKPAAHVLARRIRRLSVARSNRSLDHAAARLYREQARWEAATDPHMLTSIMHGFVNVLEEVARQIVGRPKANLGQALAILIRNGTITKAQRGRMNEAWHVRNRRSGVGHGAGPASKELAGHVIYLALEGLSDLLDAGEAQQRRRA